MSDFDVEGLQLASRFSLPPNSLGYCGKGSATEKFKECVLIGDCKGVDSEITKFIVLHPYLKTIAEMANLPFTSHEVVECFWLGNGLLKKAGMRHYDLLLQNFLKQGVPKWLVDELKERKPKRFIPCHIFQVLHVGVGRASGAVPFNLDSQNNCMIRWGKVEAINGEFASVVLNTLVKKGTRYDLKLSRENHPFIPGFLSGLKIGDDVAVHWKQVVKILTLGEVQKLTFWTGEVLESLG